MQVTEQRTDVDGVEVFWRRAEPDAGAAPVVYVHGVPNNADLWEPFLARTGGIALDLPGFGRSAKPAELRLLDRGLRPLPRVLPARGRSGPLLAGGARLGRGGPGHRAAAARAARPAGALHGRAAAARLPLAPDRARVADAGRGRAVDGVQHPVGPQADLQGGQHHARPAARRRRSTASGSTSTTAPSARSSGSTARLRPRCWRPPGEELGAIDCPSLVLWSDSDPYIGTEFGQAYARGARRRAQAGDRRGRRALELAGPPGAGGPRGARSCAADSAWLLSAGCSAAPPDRRGRRRPARRLRWRRRLGRLRAPARRRPPSAAVRRRAEARAAARRGRAAAGDRGHRPAGAVGDRLPARPARAAHRARRPRAPARPRPEAAESAPWPRSTWPPSAKAACSGWRWIPGFARNRFVYLYRTTDSGNEVARYRFEGDRLTEDAVILDGLEAAPIHDGGRIHFGPDGLLYVSTGEAGNPDLAQDDDSLNGKFLRLRDFRGGGGEPEAIDKGHRNVQGFDWDADGRMFATEFGDDSDDEVNLIRRGAQLRLARARGHRGRRRLHPRARGLRGRDRAVGRHDRLPARLGVDGRLRVRRAGGRADPAGGARRRPRPARTRRCSRASWGACAPWSRDPTARSTRSPTTPTAAAARARATTASCASSLPPRRATLSRVPRVTQSVAAPPPSTAGPVAPPAPPTAERQPVYGPTHLPLRERVDWWRLAPSALAALLAAVYLIDGAALARPGGARVPRRAVRAGGVHDLERPVVRRPPHPGLLAALAPARAGCWARS